MTVKFIATCPTCPFTGEYASQAKADYALRVHFCSLQITKAAIKARQEAREAAVDRTPKPCHHKRVRHQHGTYVCYTVDRCRCLPCKQANAAATNERYRLKAYGRYNKYADAEPVRQHLRTLTAQGMGWKWIAEVAGVPTGVVTSILYGKHRDGRNTGLQKRILRTNYDKLMAVTFTPRPGRTASREESEAARRKARALVALGWSMSKIGTWLGIHPANACSMITGSRLFHYDTIKAIDNLYEQLSMRLPPATNQREKISVARSKRYAREHGWVPPLELEASYDEHTPDQGEHPGECIDEQAIWRVLHGDRTVRLTKAEKIEAVRQWQASGRPLNELVRMTGWEVWRYIQKDLEVAS